METKELKIEIPSGFEIDIKNTDLKTGKIKLKQIKEELDWTDFGELTGWFIDKDCDLAYVRGVFACDGARLIYPTKQLAEASLALCQLLQWRNKVWEEDNWRPDWANGNQPKSVITVVKDNIDTDNYCVSKRTLAFRTDAIRDKFLKQHKSLIEKAKELL